MINHEDILNTLPLPVLLVSNDNVILYANTAAEIFFAVSSKMMRRQKLGEILPFSSPISSLVDDVRRRGIGATEHSVEVGTPKMGSTHLVDVSVEPMVASGSNGVLVMLRERTLAEKLDRQLSTNRGTARSLSALGAVLAHEIKNPLSGIRGAAQLLETSSNENDKVLTQLICDETDRIVKLVDQMEFLGFSAVQERHPVNVHDMMDQVKRVAQNGFAAKVKFIEQYDPSLPPVLADRDQLVQVILNLVKNAAEALTDRQDGAIRLSTAYRTGVRVQQQGTNERISLPIELSVQDNGPGIAEDLLPDLFDPFITTKSNGTGLGLPLVAKIVNDHGGIVECDPTPGKTTFRLLLPMYREGH